MLSLVVLVHNVFETSRQSEVKRCQVRGTTNMLLLSSNKWIDEQKRPGTFAERISSSGALSVPDISDDHPDLHLVHCIPKKSQRSHAKPLAQVFKTESSSFKSLFFLASELFEIFSLCLITCPKYSNFLRSCYFRILCIKNVLCPWYIEDTSICPYF